MDPITTTNPAHAIILRGLRHVFEGGTAAQRWEVSLIYIALGPPAIAMSSPREAATGCESRRRRPS